MGETGGVNRELKHVFLKAKTRNVPNNYASTQDAVEDATDGDIMFVFNGLYCENLLMNRSMKLIGEDEDKTITDGEKEGIQFM
ncbi:MAG TPA: hypothetical protein EYP23_06560 [Thermoplasmata archaeon]|nr:hypothetical protein [Thermoplasmata archaeon]